MHQIFIIAPILLDIIDHLDVSSLLSLRLVNKTTNQLIETYESSITKRIATKLCPAYRCEVLTDRNPLIFTDLGYFLQLDLAHRLATKYVASAQQPRLGDAIFQGIPPDDGLGNEIRQKLQNGLMNASHLSRMHKDLMKVRRSLLYGKKRRLKDYFASRPFPELQPSPVELQRQWEDHMLGLSIIDRVDFMIAFWCLKSRLIRDYQRIDDRPALWNDILAVTERDAVAWITRHIALKGLSFIDKLWSKDSTASKVAQSEIQSEIKQKSAKVIVSESQAYASFLRKQNSEYRRPDPRAIYGDVNGEADCYCESTFACRIGPGHEDLSPDQLHRLRYECAVQSMMRIGCHMGSGSADEDWKKRFRYTR
ncbi:MAG: hypothetical protein Q9202_007314 [Teloschistes flavicans]